MTTGYAGAKLLILKGSFSGFLPSSHSTINAQDVSPTPMPSKFVVWQFGPYQFIPSQQELRHGTERKGLPNAMNRLLLLLVSHAGELVTREQIARALWTQPDTVDITPGINVASRRLRTMIGDGNGNGVFIETVVGAGYRFAAPVTMVGETLPVDTAAPEIRPDDMPGAPRIPWKLTAAIGAVGICMLSALAALGWHRLHSRSSGPTDAAPLLSFPGIQPITSEQPEDELSAQAVSPSGKYVAYSDRNGLFVRTLATGLSQRLGFPAVFTVARIAWYPDETGLLISASGTPASTNVTADPETQSSLWRVFLDGRASKPLLGAATLGTIAPSGTQVAFLRSGQTELWVADTQGEAARRVVRLTNGDTFGYLLWSPDGQRLVADRSVTALTKLPPADGGRPSNNEAEPTDQANSIYESYDARRGALLAKRPGVHFQSAILLADGTFCYPTASKGSEPSIAVAHTDPSTGAFRSDPTLLASREVFSASFRDIQQISASADGKVVSAILDRPATHVFLADLEESSGGQIQLAHESRLSRHTVNTLPTAWSPDGKMIISDDGTLGPISVIGETLEDASVRQFASSRSNAERYAQGHFSPDGKWLLYLHLAPGGGRVASIEYEPAAGGSPRVLPVRGQISDFRCSTSPVGRCAVREIEGNHAIVFYALDPVAGMQGELLRTPWKPSVLGDWSISPDGKTIAVADHDPAHPGVQLHSLETDAMKKISVAGYGTVLGACWAMDGRHLFVHTSAPANYSLLYVGTDGKLSLLRQSLALLWAVPSRDGKRVAFPLYTSSNPNVWVGESNGQRSGPAGLH